jgi:2',3'-cyclic-nucleotide 2'-phosphodiesterase (5'-nucleotidase family)
MIKRLLFTLLSFLFLTITTFGEKREVHILSVNDMHATIEVFPQLAALIDSLRKADPSLLVFSAGDNRTGNPLSDKYEIPAYPMVALMNQVGFNASTLGNHEFDVNSLSRIVGLSNFRYICSNVFPSDSVGIQLIPCQVFDVEGVKVGVLGAIQLSPQGIPSTHPDNIRGISFTDPFETIKDYEWMSRECDVTILLSHLGYEADKTVAASCPWLDMIIGGHTHTQLSNSEPLHNGVLITQNKNKFGRVTYTTLTLENDEVIDKRAEYIDVKKYPKKDPLIEAMVNHFSNNAEFKRIVGVAESPFEVREELGCMVCDAFIEKFNADVAVENPGGVRIDSLRAGNISVLDVLKMDPFDNHAVVLELTGNELLEMMLTYCHNSIISFPYVGGMKCDITLDPLNDKKIKSVKFLTPNGKKMDMKRKYRVVTNNYIPATSKIPEGSDQLMIDLTTDIIMEYITKHGSVDYQGVRRLRIR